MFEIGRLGLGTVQFGLSYGISNSSGQTTIDESQTILRVASDAGIRIVDTAIEYGESESRIGSFNANEFKIVTKIPYLNLGAYTVEDLIKKYFSSSRIRLNSNSVYGLLLHRPDQLLEPYGKEIWRELEVLKSTGFAKKIGISISSFRNLDQILNHYKVDLVQVPVNPFDHRLISDGWLDKLKNQGVEIHSRSTFLQGLLLMELHEIPNKFHEWDAVFVRWHTWLLELGVSPLEACLQFPFSIPDIDCVLVGVNSAKQLDEILNISKREFRDGAWSSFACDDELLVNPSHWDRL